MQDTTINKFSAVIFDMDGLLLDSETLALAAFQRSAAHFDLGDLSYLFKRCIGTNMALGKAILQDGLKGLADAELFGQHWEADYKLQTKDKVIPLKNGVIELLQHITTLSIPMAVATSTGTSSAKAKLEKANLLQYFNCVVGGDQVLESKPQPDIYFHAASLLSVSPQRCLALEDSANGVKAAVSAQMTVVQIPDLVEPSAEIKALNHIILNDLTQVCDYCF